MIPAHIDDFYATVAEALCQLYAVFPRRALLLVEEISGPIKWDMTGLPDKRSESTFETLMWLGDHGFLKYRSVEPRSIGVEGAVLSQRAFVLLTGPICWQGEPACSRIDALRQSRAQRAYADLATLVNDLFRANCWESPHPVPVLQRAAGISVSEEEL
jgi:hypothetical protein